MSGFDYPWTCPEIDKDIGCAKIVIEDAMESILRELTDPLKIPVGFEEEGVWVEYNTQTLYNNLEDVFENTRNTNDAMRKEAGVQITNLEEQLANLKYEYVEEIKELNDIIRSLECNLYDLQT